MLRSRLTASFGEPGSSSHGTVLATTQFPLEAAAHHPVKGGRPGRLLARTSEVGEIESQTDLIKGFVVETTPPNRPHDLWWYI